MNSIIVLLGDQIQQLYSLTKVCSFMEPSASQVSGVMEKNYASAFRALQSMPLNFKEQRMGLNVIPPFSTTHRFSWYRQLRELKNFWTRLYHTFHLPSSSLCCQSYSCNRYVLLDHHCDHHHIPSMASTTSPTGNLVVIKRQPSVGYKVFHPLSLVLVLVGVV